MLPIYTQGSDPSSSRKESTKCLKKSSKSQPETLNGDNSTFLTVLKNMMECGKCSSISAPRPYSVICALGHVHCTTCIAPGPRICPMLILQEDSDKEILCGKELTENDSIVYKRIFDATKHYCQFPYCLVPVRGDCLKIHMESCTFSSIQMCQSAEECKMKTVPMNKYAEHLFAKHHISLTSGSVNIIRVPVTEFVKYSKTKCFVTNLFQASKDLFGLTFVAKGEDLCVMITAISIGGMFEKRFCFKLVIRGNAEIRRSVSGRIGTLSEVRDTVNRCGDYIQVGRSTMEEGFFAVQDENIFEVMIMDTANFPLTKWEDCSL